MDRKSLIAGLVILLVLVVDQSSKFWVKTNMYLGQEYAFLSGLMRIHFTENEGMAFGMTFGGEYGKLFLTLFRIVLVLFILRFLIKLIDKKVVNGLLISIALIFAGAIGNIIDSIFYGVIFSESVHRIADFLPMGGGYSTWLHGRVVDMLYFPLLEGFLPDWIPIWGGEYFIFFRPVFNVADAAITVGVFMIILFQKRYFEEGQPKIDPEFSSGHREENPPEQPVASPGE